MDLCEVSFSSQLVKSTPCLEAPLQRVESETLNLKVPSMVVLGGGGGDPYARGTPVARCVIPDKGEDARPSARTSHQP